MTLRRSFKVLALSVLAGTLLGTSAESAPQHSPTSWYYLTLQKRAQEKAAKKTSPDRQDRDQGSSAPLKGGVSAGPVRASVISWGANTNDPSWNQALGVNGARLGCSTPPQACAASADSVARSAGVKSVYISFILKNDTAADYGAQFSALSLSHPQIAEIGVDDFKSQYLKIPAADKDAFLRQVIAGVKSRNPRLAFGITLYLDDLNTPTIENLPRDIRARVDNIHLYTKYRTDGARYASYVSTAKSEFPNARIIGGVYAMDRGDYVPCEKGGRGSCDSDTEARLFQQTLRSQISLLRQGSLAALEFYPGNFGREDRISNFDNAKQCQPARRAQCVANTQKLRAIARSALQNR